MKAFVALIGLICLAAAHSEAEHLVMEGRMRYEGFLAGFLGQSDYTLAEHCMPETTMTQVEDIFHELRQVVHRHRFLRLLGVFKHIR